MANLTYQNIVDIINGGGVVFLDCGGVPKLIDSIPDIPPDLTICGFVERNLSEYIIVGSPANGQIPAYNSTTSKLQWTTPASGGGAWGTITGTLSNQTDLQTALNLKASINTTDGILPYKSGSGTLADSPITRIDASTIQVAAINGGSGANDDIIIQGTSNATRTTSYVNLQPNGGNVGIGVIAPASQFTLRKYDSSTTPNVLSLETNAGRRLIQFGSEQNVESRGQILLFGADDGTNYERLKVMHTGSASGIYFESQAAGTGVARNFLFAGGKILATGGLEANPLYMNSDNGTPVYIDFNETSTTRRASMGFAAGSADLVIKMVPTNDQFTGTERLRLTSSGLLGINSTSPAAQLDVRPSSSGTIGAIVQGASAQTANLMEWRNSVGTVLSAVTADGGMVVGANAASYGKVHIKGVVGNTALGIVPDADTNEAIAFSNAAASRNFIFRPSLISGAAGWAIYGQSPLDLELGTNSVRRMTIKYNGEISMESNVAVGSTSTTAARLFISGTAGLTNIYVIPAQDSDAVFALSNAATTRSLIIKSQTLSAEAGFSLYGQLNVPLEFGTNSTARMTILGTGEIGIGTTVPDAQLTINSQDVARPSLKIRALAGTASTQNVFESYNSSGTLTSYIQDNGASYFGNGLIVNNGIVTISNGSASKLMVSNTDCRLASDSQIGWSSSTTATSANADTAFVRATVKVASLTDGSTGGATLRTVPDSPTQLTADQNNYQAGTGRSMFYRLSSDASRSITGFNPAGGTNQDGELHYFINVGSNNIVLVNESASSTAGNRFLNVTGADITLATNEMAMLVYDNTSARWRVAKM